MHSYAETEKIRLLRTKFVVIIISAGWLLVPESFRSVFLVLFVFVPFLVSPILPVSLDCTSLIAPLVFSNIYIQFKMDLGIQIPEPYITTENRSSVKNRHVLVTARVVHQNIITY